MEALKETVSWPVRGGWRGGGCEVTDKLQLPKVSNKDIRRLTANVYIRDKWNNGVTHD
jgi:hypothetical protein